MPELIEFPDVEALLREAANVVLPGLLGTPLQAFLKRPPAFPDSFVVFTRTGGAPRDLVTDIPTLAVDAYAARGGSPWESEAVRVFQRTAAWLRSLEVAGQVGGVPVYEVAQTSGPYRNPDPLAPKHARFSGVFTVALRGATVHYQ